MREPHLEVFHQDESKLQRVYRFSNGYGASVVKGPETHGGPDGLWELAVIRYHGTSPIDFRVDKTTTVGDHVHGYLTEGDVDTFLAIIERLNPYGTNAQA